MSIIGTTRKHVLVVLLFDDHDGVFHNLLLAYNLLSNAVTQDQLVTQYVNGKVFVFIVFEDDLG